LPITIQYGPAGLAGALAVQSGAGAGLAQAQDQDFKYAQLNLQAQAEGNRVSAQNRAFDLQDAAEQFKQQQALKTPVADHIQEKADLYAAQKTAQQKVLQAQADKMLASGSIDQATHQKITFGIMEGNKDLVTHLFQPPKPGAAEKPAISNAEELDLIRQPFRERRKLLDQEEVGIRHKLADPDTQSMYPQQVVQGQQRLKEIAALRNSEFENETQAVNQRRQQGPQAPTATPTQGGTVSFTPTMTDSEQTVERFLQENAGNMAKVRVGGGGTVTGTVKPYNPTPASAQPISAPAKEQRIVGQSYLLPNGKTGVWRGTGWEIQ
jgi:hypothetical protein